jgi:hypothetical protein
MMSSNMLKKTSWLVIVVTLGLAACAPIQGPAQEGSTESAPEQPHATPSPAGAPTTPLEATPAPAEPGPGAPYPLATVAPSEAPIIGEVPGDVMEKVMADLENRVGAQLTNVSVIRSEAVTWNDGSLGCPQPGLAYTQQLIDGYWIVLQVGGTTYDYRVGGRRNTVVLCEQPQRTGGDTIPPTAVLIVPDKIFPSVTPVQP